MSPDSFHLLGFGIRASVRFPSPALYFCLEITAFQGICYTLIGGFEWVRKLSEHLFHLFLCHLNLFTPPIIMPRSSYIVMTGPALYYFLRNTSFVHRCHYTKSNFVATQKEKSRFLDSSQNGILLNFYGSSTSSPT